MIEGCNCLADIDAFIERKQSFAVYRIPGENSFSFVTQTNGGISLLNSIEELDGKKGYVIAPFQVKEENPVVLIQPDRIETSFVLNADVTDTLKQQMIKEYSMEYSPCSDSYSACFNLFINALCSGAFDKLVLSRSLSLEKDERFSPSVAFYKACCWYVHSYVYLCYTPQTGIWLGSTPEIILAGEKGRWNTVALAGTQSLQRGELPQVWDNKNRKEQEYVTSYIRQQLHSLGISPTENGPYPAYAGTLSHLKTDFCFSLYNNKELGKLLNSLHPTPAVCGLPKDEAYRFILENEGYDRKYYSGFVGWLDPDGKTDLYVNLRCMNITDRYLTLYAGGGLLASSEVNDEWQETEKKLQTMKRICF